MSNLAFILLSASIITWNTAECVSLDRNSDLSPEDHNHTVTSCPTLEVLQGREGRDGRDGISGKDGRDGRDGRDGEKGERGDSGPQGLTGLTGPAGPSTGGVVYTHWGRTTCPDTTGTQLVYSGRAVGSHWNHRGGGTNYLCLPEEPIYHNALPGYQRYPYVYGTEYIALQGGPLSRVNRQNVPCAVCLVRTRQTLLMIPARNICPPSWTLEYSGYLMTEDEGHHRSTLSV